MSGLMVCGFSWLFIRGVSWSVGRGVSGLVVHGVCLCRSVVVCLGSLFVGPSLFGYRRLWLFYPVLFLRRVVWLRQINC